MITKDFTIHGRTKAISDGDNLYIRGLANTGQEDLEGDTVTKDALKQIVQQIPTHNLHLDHDKTVHGILGPLIEGAITPDGVQFTARILDEKRQLIESYLNQGVNLGASIAGCVEYDDTNSSVITEWKLTEISLTGIPADQGTMASVEIAKSFKNVIEKLKKTYGDENMADETYITQEECIQLINDAFNEKQEELLEQIRKEIKDEYEVVITELKERLDGIETQINTQEETPEETPEATGDGETGEEKEDEEEDEEKTDEEEDEEKTEDEDTEIDEKTLERAVTKKLTQISKNIHYKYKAQQKNEEKNLHTPHELAKMALRR